MAIYRNIDMAFWTDGKVVDDFTPEDKYFYLYLITNPHTNLCGCYEISTKQMSNETGYNTDTLNKLLERFQNIHTVIEYSKETKEVLLLNWSKYNWSASPKLDKPLLKDIESIKNTRFRDFLGEIYNKRETISIPYQYGIEKSGYPMDTTVTVTVTDTVLNTPKKGVIGGNKAAIEKRFNDLWALYPRKQGRADALKSYEKAVKAGVTDEAIKQGIENYIKQIAAEKTEQRFIKQGSTFFSKQAWTDDYKVSTAQPIEYKEELPY